MFSCYFFSDNFMFLFFVYHWWNSLYCELMFEICQTSNTGNSHIFACALCYFLFLLLLITRIPRRKRSAPFTLVICYSVSSRVAKLSVQALPRVWFCFFFIFLFTAIVSLYTQTVTLYALAYIHTLPTTNYSVRLYTIHAREIPPRPYKPFSFLFSCVLTLTAFLALSLALVVSYFGCVLSRRALFSLLLYFRLFFFLKLSILLIHVR